MKREEKRRELLDRLADFLLANGLAAATLRDLAAAAETSDRMLLYYFADKDELMAAVLARVAERLTGVLSARIGQALPEEVLLPKVCRLLTSEPLKPYMRLWLELAAEASRNREPYRTVAERLVAGFLAWTAGQLAVAPGQDAAREAARVLATVEGVVLLDAIGQAGVARQVYEKRKGKSGRTSRGVSGV